MHKVSWRECLLAWAYDHWPLPWRWTRRCYPLRELLFYLASTAYHVGEVDGYNRSGWPVEDDVWQ